MTPTWAVAAIVALVAGLVIAFLIRGYLFMDKVEGNHLAHMQSDLSKTAQHTLDLYIGMRDHDMHEQAHHTQMMERLQQETEARRREFEALRDLIRTHGL